MTVNPLLRLPKNLLGLGLMAGLPATGFAQGFSENFNNGAASASNWTLYSPLTAFGAPASTAVVSGAFKIDAAGSPAPGLVGPGRGGSFRTDQILGDVTVSYDLVSWGTTPFFAGAFIRANELGLGTTDAYAAGYDFSTSRLFISVVENENVKGVVSVSDPVTLDPAKTYRLTFNAIGQNLSGVLVDNGDGSVLAQVAGTDASYASGVIGLGLAVQSTTAGVGATVTFDNVVATVPEPSLTALIGLGAVSLGLARRGRRPTL